VKDFSALCITPYCSIKEAIKVIDSGGAQVALVVENQRLIGLVTDGDVRRGLIRGEAIESPIALVMRKDFRYAPEGSDEQDALMIMRREGLHHLPVLDASGNVVGLRLLDEIVQVKKMANIVVMMAGGEGRRLRPLTQNCPKPMLRVAGKPMLEIILEQCIRAGFSRFYISVNYLKEQISEYFEDGSKWGVSISYLEEDHALGTAGALGLLPRIPTEPFLLVNGDVLSRVSFKNLIRFHMEQGAIATVGVREHNTQIPFGVLKIRGSEVLDLEEKPLLNHYVNAGIYLLDPGVINFVSSHAHLDMPDLLKSIIRGKLGKVSAFPIHEYWLDVGIPETFALANGEWS
jgi:dTDP-glucose pyrophosphorylase